MLKLGGAFIHSLFYLFKYVEFVIKFVLGLQTYNLVVILLCFDPKFSQGNLLQINMSRTNIVFKALYKRNFVFLHI